MNMERIKAEVKMMRKWCEEHYESGGSTMVECWSDTDYESLFVSSSGGAPLTKREAWRTLLDMASVYRERDADAAYYAEHC